MRETTHAVNLHRDRRNRDRRRTVHDVVVVRSEEQVDDGANVGDILTVGLIGEAISVDVGARAAIEIGNLKDKVGGFEKGVDEGDDAKMLDLVVHNLDELSAIGWNTDAIVHKGIVCRGIGLEVGGGEKPKVVDHAIGGAGIVPLLSHQQVCHRGVVDALSDLAQKPNQFIGPVLKIRVTTNGRQHMTHAQESGGLALDLGLIARVDELLEVAESNC